MILSSLTIQGFKSFDKPQTVDFSENSPGLYFLTGENKTQPSLGANGAGKTTVLDALCWVLFDRTTRGLKAKNIKNWSGDEKVKVSVDFQSRLGSKITLVRTWSPNSLKWCKDESELETVTQVELEQEIGLNYDTFIQTLIIPQFASMFFDKKPTEQATLLTEILDIKEWLQYSDYTKRLLSEQESRASDVQSTIDTLNGQLIQLSNTELLGESDTWEEEHLSKIRQQKSVIMQLKQKVADLEKNIPEAADTSAFEKDIEDIEAELSEVLEKINACNEEMAECHQVISEMNPEIDDTEEEVRRIDKFISNLRTEIRMHNSQIKKFEDLEGQCPTCGQDVDANHIEVEVKPLQDKIKKIEDEIESALKDQHSHKEKVGQLRESRSEAKEILDEIQSEKDELRDLKTELDSKKSKAKSKISEASLVLDNHKYQIEAAKNQVTAAQSHLSDLESESNPYKSQIARNKEREKLLKKQKKGYEVELKDALEECNMLRYWVKHFKNIRTYCISQALMQLQVEVNTNLARLGLADWSIHFDVERETTSNTIKKEFQVYIQSPHNEGLVPWECWSGGESQRLRIAGTTGLASLILARKGIETNVEFWDEPTNGLNQKGVEDLMATLSEHSKDNGKQVWVVDHRSLSFGNFKKSVCITKDEDGSHVEVIDA